MRFCVFSVAKNGLKKVDNHSSKINTIIMNNSNNIYSKSLYNVSCSKPQSLRTFKYGTLLFSYHPFEKFNDFRKKFISNVITSA